MAADTRMMNSVEAERVRWFERCISDGMGDFEYEFSSAENKNTKRKTETDMRIFSSFLFNMSENRPAETIEPEELDRYLTTFFSVIKKHDGNEYEPASLRGMLCSIERYLRARNYTRSLTRDTVFVGTRNTLRDRQIVLREIAKTSKKNKQEMLTASSVEKLKQLYNAREFGPYNPMAVINTLCFAFVVHLKIRKAIDHKQLLWGDIVLKVHNSREYLCYEPVQGRDFLRQRLNNISGYRIYAQTDSTSPADPVAVYKLYASKRPSQAMCADSPFYLGLAVNGQTINHYPHWFRCSPMGVNKLNDLVRMIREITGNLTMSITGNITNIMDSCSSKYMPGHNPPPPPYYSDLKEIIQSDDHNTSNSDSNNDIPEEAAKDMQTCNSEVPRSERLDESEFNNGEVGREPDRSFENTKLDRSPVRSVSDGEHDLDIEDDETNSSQIGKFVLRLF